MNLENDKKNVINQAYQYIVKKMNCELKSFESAPLKNKINTFVNEVTSLDLFKFFPFETMTPEMLAEFCVEHLIMRGAIKLNTDKTEDSKNKSTTNLRQIMNNIKERRYGLLIERGAVDSFIINKKALGDNFTKNYDGTVPEYIDDFLVGYTQEFKQDILKPDISRSNSVIIDSNKMIIDLKEKFCYFFQTCKSLLSSSEGHPLFFISWIHWKQKILRCMVEAVNHIIFKSMVLFIMDRFCNRKIHISYNPEHIKNVLSNKELSLMSFKDYLLKMRGEVDNSRISSTLDNLSKFIDENIEKPIAELVEGYREQWCDFNKTGIDNAMTQELSLKFAYYLHGIIIDGYKYEIVKAFNDADKKDNNPYSDGFESSAHNPEEQKKYISGSNNPSERDNDFEEAGKIAQKFYYKKGYDAGGEDLIYCKKIFYQELYVHPVYIRDTSGKRILARTFFSNRENLPLNQEIFLQAALDHAHFRQKHQLDVYMKFYDVLNKLWRITETSFLTLEAKTGLNVLRRILFIYLQFYDDYS